MQYLSQLLGGPDKTREFLGRNFTRLPFSVAGGASQLKHYLDWSVVERSFKEKKSTIRIVKDGRMTEFNLDQDYAKAKYYYNQGHSIWVKNAERSIDILNDLAKDFSSSFYTAVDVQLYCTPEGHNAFGWHYDVEEVFILQTEGSKEYTIRQNTVHPYPLVKSIPINLGFEQESSDLALKVTLMPGDCLYIPSGWWHIARTKRESKHISIGLMPSSAMDIVEFLQLHLPQHSMWRKRMPIHTSFETSDEEIEFYQEAMAKLGEEIVSKISSKDFIRQFLSHKKSPLSEIK